ncbi:MAG: hypothetical protein JO230_00530 [Xanthobacteraceae bacterium]|nr:hypothetical protein [Xanthobacteraceae bacterium]
MSEVNVPRFFFDYFDGRQFYPAEVGDGIDLPDAEAAYLEAFQAAVEVWGEALREGRNPILDCFRVRGQDGIVVLELPFVEVLESSRGGARRPPPLALRNYDPRRAHEQVERGRRIMQEQQNRVDRLKAQQRDTSEAERTLDTFANVVVIMEEVLRSVDAMRRY